MNLLQNLYLKFVFNKNKNKSPAYRFPDRTRKKKSVHGEWIQFKEKKLATVNCQNEEQLSMIEFIFACKILSQLNKYLNKECYPQGLRVYGCSQNYMEFIYHSR